MSGVHLGRDTLRLLVARVMGYALALINSVILARSLGVEGLGAYAYAMGIAALFGLVPNLGINHIVTRAIAQSPQTGGGVPRAAVRAQAALAGGVFLLIPAFARVLPGQPVPLAYVALAGAQMAVGTLSWPHLAVLGGHTRYGRVAAAELASALVGTATLLGAVALHGGVPAVLLAHLLAAAVSAAIAWRLTRPFLPPDRGPTVGVGDLLRQAAPFGAGAAAQSLYTRLDILLLGQLASTRALGLYSVAYKPTNMLVFLGSTLAAPVFPLMVQASPGEAPAPFHRALRGLGLAGPGMALALTGLAGPLLHGLYGPEYVSAAPLLAILAWSAAANWLYAPLGMALQARRQERAWLVCLGGALALNATGNLWAIPRWGALGAAATTLASEVVLLALGAALVGGRLGLLPPLRPIMVGLGATALGLAALWLVGAGGALPATVTALAAYGGLLILLRGITAEDAATLIGWVRQVAPAWSRG